MYIGAFSKRGNTACMQLLVLVLFQFTNVAIFSISISLLSRKNNACSNCAALFSSEKETQHANKVL
jgi:hypothetical protein